MRKVLIAGATSAIARETAALLAHDGDRLFLVGRDPLRLGVVADDVRVRGADRVDTLALDLDEVGRHEEVVGRAIASLEGLDAAVVAHGILGDPEQSHRDFAAAEAVIRTNFLSAASLLTVLARRFEDQGAGTLVGISSVAGDRGRQSNYVYGASKGALSLFLQGLRSRLHAKGVAVITVKPGLVDTPMTAHLPKGLLFANASTVARGIHRAMRRQKDVVYLPWFWRIIMTVISLIPESIFKRLKL